MVRISTKTFTITIDGDDISVDSVNEPDVRTMLPIISPSTRVTLAENGFRFLEDIEEKIDKFANLRIPDSDESAILTAIRQKNLPPHVEKNENDK